MQLRAAIAASLEENRQPEGLNNCKVDESDDDSELETFDSDTETGFSSKTPKEPKKPLVEDKLEEKPPSPESWEKYLVPESNSSADIIIRFPDGKRERKSFPSQSPLKVSYLFCCFFKLSALVIKFLKNILLIFNFHFSLFQILYLYVSSKGYNMNDYDLVINFPKKNLKEFSENDSLSSAGLCPGNTVFVHMKS